MLKQLLTDLPETVVVQRVLGGLAPDSDEPMPSQMQHMLQETWRRIQTVIPDTRFNFDFWSNNQPKRSTWPSCRAVLAACQQNSSFEVPMINAIQESYYLHAQNPSETQTLVELASNIGCDSDQFKDYLHSQAAHDELAFHRQLAQQLGAQGFPSLIYMNAAEQFFIIPINYNDSHPMLKQIEGLSQS